MSPRAKRADAIGRGLAMHSSGDHDWGTNRELVDIERAVLGHISVDPFSSPKWNELVGAKRIITEAEDGYETPWFDGAPIPGLLYQGEEQRCPFPNDNTCHVNAPGDRSGMNIKRAWWIMERYHALGWMAGGGVWVGFSLNGLQTCQSEPGGRDAKRNARSPLHRDFVRCIPDHRVAYYTEPGVPCGEPTHPSWFALLPSLDAAVRERQIRAFTALCERLGDVF